MRYFGLILAGSLLGAASAPANAQEAMVWQTSEGEIPVPTAVRAGMRIKVPYTQDGGRIIGTFSRNGDGNLVLTGHWIEDSSAKACDYEIDGSASWGELVFTFDADMQSFKGLWGYCNIAPDSGWTGTKTGKTSQAVETLAPSTAGIENLVDRLATERRRAGPRPAGAPPLTYDDADLERLRSQLGVLNISDADMATLVDEHFGTGSSFDPAQWDDFADYAKRIHVSPEEREAVEGFERALHEIVGLPQEAVDYLHDRFYQTDSLRHDVMSQIYGSEFHKFALDSLLKDPKLVDMLSPAMKAKLEDLSTPPIEGPLVRPLEETDRDYTGIDCSYDAVLARMKAADPSFAIKWDIHVNYGSMMGSVPGVSVGNVSDTLRRRLRAGHLEAMKQCERNKQRRN